MTAHLTRKQTFVVVVIFVLLVVAVGLVGNYVQHRIPKPPLDRPPQHASLLVAGPVPTLGEWLNMHPTLKAQLAAAEVKAKVTTYQVPKLGTNVPVPMSASSATPAIFAVNPPTGGCCPKGWEWGPKGYYWHCSPHNGIFPPAVWAGCSILMQPSTTYDWKKFFDQAGGLAEEAVAGVAAGACGLLALAGGPMAVIAPLLAATCLIVAGYYAVYVVYYTGVARGYHQCLRIRFDAGVIADPLLHPFVDNVLIDDYGQWETTLVGYVNGNLNQPYQYWGYPTSCKMPRNCVIATGGLGPCII